MKCNKIELLLFLKKYNIISESNYFSSLTDGKDSNDTIPQTIKDKDILKIKEIKKKLKKEKKINITKELLKNLEYVLFSLAYIVFLFEVTTLPQSFRVILLQLLVATCFALSTLKIFKSDYKNKVKKINSELNIISFIENKICINN